METSLPDDKIHELLSKLRSWYSCKKCRKRELLSLIGNLNFACRIIPAGRIFLRRLNDLSTRARLPNRHVTMNREARRDISWYLRFLPSWNGRAIIPTPTRRDPRIWNSSQMPREVSAMASFSWVIGPLASCTPKQIDPVDRTLHL